MTGAGYVQGAIMGRWDHTGIVAGAEWRLDGVWPARTSAFTLGEMGRQWRLLSRARLMYVARNNPYSFFLLLKHAEAINRARTPRLPLLGSSPPI